MQMKKSACIYYVNATTHSIASINISFAKMRSAVLFKVESLCTLLINSVHNKFSTITLIDHKICEVNY